MKDITNKEIRKELILRYLNVETSPDEERLLARYFACNEADEDEAAIARMLRMERCDASLLSDEGVEEFDRIVRKTSPTPRRMRLRWMPWAAGIAATVALCFALRSPSPQPSFSTVETAQELQQMMSLEIEGTLSLTATSIDGCILLKAGLEDGSVKTFIMSKDPKTGTTSLLSIN